jgi:uncharacterized delta-60 repeat protein
LTGAGELDTNYAGSGCLNVNFPGSTQTALNAGALQGSDGSLVVAGFAKSAITGFREAAVARIGPTGIPDSNFATNGYFLDSCVGTESAATKDCELASATVAATGIIYAAGEITVDSTDSDFVTLALDSLGQLDTSFAGDGRAFVAFDLAPNFEMHDRALAVASFAGGDLGIAGYAAYNTGPPLLTKAAIAFLDSHGSIIGSDSFYLGSASGYTSRVAAVGVEADHKFLLAGATRLTSLSNDQFAVARLTAAPNRHFDPNFGDGSNGVLIDFADGDGAGANANAIVFDVNRPVIAGTRSTSGSSQFAVARLTSELIFANGLE